MNKHKIEIDVILDKEQMPEHIGWSASGSSAEEKTAAKAFMLSLWDGGAKEALRMDLWTKQMMVDEMYDFYFQTIMTMADTMERSTKNTSLGADMRTFAKDFKKKADDMLKAEETNTDK